MDKGHNFLSKTSYNEWQVYKKNFIISKDCNKKLWNKQLR